MQLNKTQLKSLIKIRDNLRRIQVSGHAFPSAYYVGLVVKHMDNMVMMCDDMGLGKYACRLKELEGLEDNIPIVLKHIEYSQFILPVKLDDRQWYNEDIIGELQNIHKDNIGELVGLAIILAIKIIEQRNKMWNSSEKIELK